MTMTARPPQVPATIPGPPGHPLFGMVPALRRDLLGTVLGGFRRYGDLVAYRFGPRGGPSWASSTAVAVHHPELVHRVLTNGTVFSRRTVTFSVLREMLGEGLLTSDGDVWLRQRRTLQPLFTPRRVTGYAQLMAAEADRILADGPVDGPVDLHELMQRYTLRVVGRTLFGNDVDDAVADLRRLVPLTGDLVLARSMQLARLPLVVPTPRNRRFRRTSAQQYAIVDRIIARRTGSGTEDLLGRLQAARDPETGAPLSADEIRDQVLVFLLAGHETTAGALTFTLHQLGLHPEIQEQVAGEEELVKAALLESMRLYPPVYGTERVTATDTELAGRPVPAGVGVIVSPYVTHRHPEFWPDPDRFDPARFAGTHDRPRYAYFPFGGGARSCIGEHFALLEATILLRALLGRYRVTSLNATLRLDPLITLRPAEPVRATLTRR